MNNSNKKFYILTSVVLLVCIGIIYYIRFPLANSNRAVAGDTVTYTFEGTYNGDDGSQVDLKTLLDPTNSYEYWNHASIVMGDHQEPEAIESALFGKKRGETVENVEVTFGDDYSGTTFTDLVGKTAHLNLTVTEVDRCSESGYACFTYNNMAREEFETNYNDFEEKNKSVNSELDAVQKLIENNDLEGANNKFNEVALSYSSLQQLNSSLPTTLEGVNIDELKQELQEKQTAAQTAFDATTARYEEIKTQLGV